MAINPTDFTEEVFMPASEPGQEWDDLHRETKRYLARNVKNTMFEKLGIDLSGETPGVDKNGNRILYELTEDGQIVDPLADTPADSEKFVEKIRMGKIFAFPAGTEKPVQLQLDLSGDDPSKMFKFSKPVEKSLFPQPERPNFWARFRHFFGGAKKEYAAYDEAMKKYRNGAAMDAQSNRQSIVGEEAEAHEKAVKERKAAEAEARAKAEAEALNASREQYHSEMDAKVDLLEEVYGAQPKMREEFLGCQYTTEQFNTLKPYDLTQMDVKGPVSNHEFAGVSILAALSPEIGGKVRNHPTLSAEENAATNNTFYTSDLYGWGNAGRAGVGTYFKDAQAPARDKAAKAFEEYKNGNKQPLGELIGKGLHFNGQHMQHKTLDESSNIAVNGALGQAVNLLERDPDLMKIAQGAGMTDKDLKIARTDRKLLEVCRANEWAKGRLAEAEQGKRTLTEGEKKACIESRLQYETLNMDLNLDVNKRETSEQYLQAAAESAELFNEESKDLKALNRKFANKQITPEEYQQMKIPAVEKQEAATIRMNTMLHAARGIPGKYESIGEAEAKNKTAEALNQLVEANLPGHAALDKLSIQDLNKALDPGKLFAKDSPYMVAPEKPPKAKEPEKQQELQQEKDGPEVKDPTQFMDKQTFQERIKTFSSPSL